MKFKTLLNTALVSITCPAIIQATTLTGAYLGPEINYSRFNYGSGYDNGFDRIKHKVTGITLLGGARVNDNFNLELGYTINKKANATRVVTGEDNNLATRNRIHSAMNWADENVSCRHQ